MIHEEIEHNIVPRRYVGASNRLRRVWEGTCPKHPLSPIEREATQLTSPLILRCPRKRASKDRGPDIPHPPSPSRSLALPPQDEG